jgi:hypothetical protein
MSFIVEMGADGSVSIPEEILDDLDWTPDMLFDVWIESGCVMIARTPPEADRE